MRPTCSREVRGLLQGRLLEVVGRGPGSAAVPSKSLDTKRKMVLLFSRGVKLASTRANTAAVETGRPGSTTTTWARDLAAERVDLVAAGQAQGGAPDQEKGTSAPSRRASGCRPSGRGPAATGGRAPAAPPPRCCSRPRARPPTGIRFVISISTPVADAGVAAQQLRGRAHGQVASRRCGTRGWSQTTRDAAAARAQHDVVVRGRSSGRACAARGSRPRACRAPRGRG